MILIFVAKLRLRLKPTNVGAQKIDGTILESYGMISAMFSIQDSLKKVQFLKKPFCWLILVWR